MDTLVAVLNQCGPWLCVVCGALWLATTIADQIVSAKIAKHLAGLEARMSPAYRELARQELAKRPRPPVRSPVPSIIWSVVQIGIGAAWFSLR